MSYKVNPFTGKVDRVSDDTGTPSSEDNIRAYAHALSPGTHSISFSSEFTSSYELDIQCYSGANQYSYKVVEGSKTSTGFQITVYDNCTMRYIAVKRA